MKRYRLFVEITLAFFLISGGIFATTTYATFTFNSGYAIGYRSGYKDGKSYGYSQGYEDGHTQGQSLGYEDGYQVGINTLACWIVQDHAIVNALYLNLTCSQS